MDGKDVVILLAFWLNVGYNKSNRGAKGRWTHRGSRMQEKGSEAFGFAPFLYSNPK